MNELMCKNDEGEFNQAENSKDEKEAAVVMKRMSKQKKKMIKPQKGS